MRLNLPFIVSVACLMAGPTLAQSFSTKDDDEVFDRFSLTKVLAGKIFEFYDDGQSQYYDDGRYSYTYAGGGGTAYGYWDVTESGAVCVTFLNEATRCDIYVMNGERMILIDENGNRFPVRP
ncbi:hypothetical protein C8N36_105241 [Pelagimonas varians]|uniref:Uncharacterized protein n=2 Tax=Pelagimonas varians TaxID=696760 RepID=A0A238KAA8_9RHOB|nr:hypothetical protein C8N36_105241 [Pelagimonas varians]SMX39799.1 hypothetical protein PEV8663_01881 [Pelagimonas varians]